MNAQSRGALGTVLLFWIAVFVLHVVESRSLLIQNYINTRMVLFGIAIASCIISGAEIILLLFTSVVPRKKDVDNLDCPLNNASVFSVITFSWITPLISNGARAHVEEDDLWDLQLHVSGRVFP